MGIFYRKEILYCWLVPFLEHNSKKSVLMFTDVLESWLVSILVIIWSILLIIWPLIFKEGLAYLKSGCFKYEYLKLRQEYRVVCSLYVVGIVIGYLYLIPAILDWGVSEGWDNVIEYEGRVKSYIEWVWKSWKAIILFSLSPYVFWKINLKFDRKWTLIGVLLLIGSITPPDVFWLCLGTIMTMALLELVKWCQFVIKRWNDKI